MGYVLEVSAVQLLMRAACAVLFSFPKFRSSLESILEKYSKKGGYNNGKDRKIQYEKIRTDGS